MSCWRILFGVLLGWIVLGIDAGAADRPERPNVVLIFTDDQGYGDVGCFGATDIKTPHIDRLAREGLRLTNFYVSQAVCTASRAALMTGCYANRVGLHGALNHQSNVGIHEDELLLPEICQRRGYATGMFGKWHLGHRPKFSPLKHGFDEFFGIPYSNDNGRKHPVVKDIPPLPLMDGDRMVEEEPDQSRFTQRFTERAVSFIERHQDRPFFLYLPHVMPHVPIFATDGAKGRSARGLYGDVVEELDDGIGRVIETLNRLKLRERTLVIFATDNGPFLSYGNHAGSAGILREGKLTTFEGGMRVPCIMNWPGQILPGRVSPDIAATIDLVPTIAELIGGELSKHRLDGLSLVRFITGAADAKSPRESYYFYGGEELQAVRKGRWKLHLPHEYLTVNGPPGLNGKPANFANMQPKSMDQSGLAGIASRHGYRVARIELALFDLEADPSERTDVAAQHPEIVAQLQALAEHARNDLGDSLTRRKSSGLRPIGKVE